MKAFYRLHNAQQGSEVMRRMWADAKAYLMAGHVLELILRSESRTLDQNAVQWPYLEAFSKQLQWPVNGALCWMEPEDWKDVLTAAFQNETVRLALGLSGGVVMLGLRTSKMSKTRFSEWIDFLKATAALRGVSLREPEEATA